MLVSVAVARIRSPLSHEVAAGAIAKPVQRPPLLRFRITELEIEFACCVWGCSVIEKASGAEVSVAVDFGLSEKSSIDTFGLWFCLSRMVV
ncbi:uncharacterized protein LOC110271249 isoform X2 [Arachis ipaensis]|uniref:uncharacterized protein LOC110271249 isoform X2 n=1 Tax=Arachis ipaensis TaxID=130454 RepID=UPI000A2B0C8F|nr:uncharacterized protein LOC110271249 isoform X2 [Arachis ipaensis]